MKRGTCHPNRNVHNKKNAEYTGELFYWVSQVVHGVRQRHMYAVRRDRCRNWKAIVVKVQSVYVRRSLPTRRSKWMTLRDRQVSDLTSVDIYMVTRNNQNLFDAKGLTCDKLGSLQGNHGNEWRAWKKFGMCVACHWYWHWQNLVRVCKRFL